VTGVFTGRLGLIVAIAMMLLLKSTSIPMLAFANDKSPDAPTLSVIDNWTEYVAKAKQAETQHDYNDAINWYQKAADLGDAESMNELGWIYFGAHDIPGITVTVHSITSLRLRQGFQLSALSP
jgi:TPR repeat protein